MKQKNYLINTTTKFPFVRELSNGLQSFADKNKNIFTLEDRFVGLTNGKSRNKEWNPEKNMFWK